MSGYVHNVLIRTLPLLDCGSQCWRRWCQHTSKQKQQSEDYAAFTTWIWKDVEHETKRHCLQKYTNESSACPCPCPGGGNSVRGQYLFLWCSALQLEEPTGPFCVLQQGEEKWWNLNMHGRYMVWWHPGARFSLSIFDKIQTPGSIKKKMHFPAQSSPKHGSWAWV